MERKIRLNDKDIVDLVTKKYEQVAELQDLTKEIEDKMKVREEKGKLLQATKDTLVPLVEKKLKGQIGEFEVFQSTTEPKNGETEVILVDFLEKFKTDFKNTLVAKKNDEKKRKKKLKK